MFPFFPLLHELHEKIRSIYQSHIEGFTRQQSTTIHHDIKSAIQNTTTTTTTTTTSSSSPSSSGNELSFVSYQQDLRWHSRTHADPHAGHRDLLHHRPKCQRRATGWMPEAILQRLKSRRVEKCRDEFDEPLKIHGSFFMQV